MDTDPTPPRVLLRSEHSDGRVSVTESVMPPGAKGPPLHVHDFWALQPVPEVTRVGPPIGERAEG